jgi:hypothetical protein
MLLDLHAFMWLLVASAGGQAAALVLGGGALAWCTTLQRRVQSCRLRVAALPGLYVVLLVLVGYSTLSVPQLFGLVLLVQAVLGFRKDMVGLLAFVPGDASKGEHGAVAGDSSGTRDTSDTGGGACRLQAGCRPAHLP